jgi:hypothetical protein
MKISAMTDTSDIRSRMREYANIVGKDIQIELRRHARLACVELANTTQPFGDEKGRAKGEKAVEVDISKVFYTPTPYGGFVTQLSEMAHKSHAYRASKSNRGFDADSATLKFTDRINGYAASGNMKALERLANNFKWQGIEGDFYPQAHWNARTGRRAKVPKRAGNMTLVMKRQSQLDAYIERMKKKVGMTKAGWAVCADKMPETNIKGSMTRGIPQWVTRNKKHRVPAASSVDASSTFTDTRNPSVKMTNAVPWTSDNLSPAQAIAAMQIARHKFVKMMNTQIKYVLRQQAKLSGAV